MFNVYKITGSFKNEYFISYSCHSIQYVLHKKLTHFYEKQGDWHPCYLLFEDDCNKISIEKIVVLENEQLCIQFIHNYANKNSGCINNRKNPYDC
jgi:hypothetical protein